MIRLEPAPRWPGWPVWAVALVAAWGSMVGTVHILDDARGSAASTCVFRVISGAPCPTCGGTRAAFALARGDPATAIRRNPLVASLLMYAPLWIGVRIGAGRRPVVDCGARGRAFLGTAVAALVIANWVYVWIAETR